MQPLKQARQEDGRLPGAARWVTLTHTRPEETLSTLRREHPGPGTPKSRRVCADQDAPFQTRAHSAHCPRGLRGSDRKYERNSGNFW